MEINGTLVGLPQHWQSWFKLKLAEVMGLGNASVIICLLKQVLHGMLAVFAKSRSKVLVFSYSTRVSACLLLLRKGECLSSLTQQGWKLIFSYSSRVSACLLLLSEGECLFSLTWWEWVLIFSYSVSVSAHLLLLKENECSSSLTQGKSVLVFSYSMRVSAVLVHFINNPLHVNILLDLRWQTFYSLPFCGLFYVLFYVCV